MKTKKYRVLLPIFLTLLMLLFSGGTLSPIKQTAHIPLITAAQLSKQMSLQLPVTSDIEEFNRTQSTDPSNCFIENKGQWAPEVKYLVQQGGMNAWITTTGIVYDFFRIERDETNTSLTDPAKQFDPANRLNPEEYKDRIIGHVVNMKLEDARESAPYFPEDKSEAYYNYFIGNDQSKWARYVGLYGEVTAANVYSNIDARYYFDEEGMRYDFILNPGANVADIKMNFEGAYGTEVNAAGELVIYTSLGEVTQRKLYAYQEINGRKEQVTCAFTKTETGTITFTADWKDKSRPLVIDPLVYSTFLGGSSTDYSGSVAVGTDGSVYVTGNIYSSDFPITVGAFDISYNGLRDVFVTKLNAFGSSLVYSTFLGGSSDEVSTSIVISTDESAFVTGYTGSNDFPTTEGAYDESHNGFLDAFIIKLNTAGAAIPYSTFLGGSGSESSSSIALGLDGSVYVTGNIYSYSSGFPITEGAFDISYNGNTDAFITKLNPTGSALVYSTFLGGSGNDDVNYSMAIDTDGSVYVTGNTESSDFPITEGAFDISYNGNTDAFITKLNPAGSALVYSTFLGGGSYDKGNSIALDSNGNAHLVGYTYSSDFPTTGGAYDVIHNSTVDAFVIKLNSSGSSLVYSTFLGGSSDEVSTSIVISTDESAFVTGYTGSNDFPTTTDAYDATHNGGWDDAFITKLNSSGSSLVYSTFLGGNGDDFAPSIALGADESAFVTGYTNSIDFPTTAGAYDESHNGDNDIFITKLELTLLMETIEIMSPNGGENFLVGSNQNISWNSENVSDVKIEYTTNNGSNWLEIVVSTPAASGAFVWEVPNTPSPLCLVRITDESNSEINDISDGVFNIAEPTNNDEEKQFPQEFCIFENYPNPFNPSTTIQYGIPENSHVRVEIFNTLGEVVEVLTNAVQAPGSYSVEWNAKDFTSGVYFYRMTAESGSKNFTQVKKLMLVK